MEMSEEQCAILQTSLGTDEHGNDVTLAEVFREPLKVWLRIDKLSPWGNTVFNLARTFRPEILTQSLSRADLEKIVYPGTVETVQ
ncbi:MAG TPA: hypothetical protein PKY31_11170 [Spirochaetota bacterium]|nr:hypothetical protein [Spirochaetota bacterium]